MDKKDIRYAYLNYFRNQMAHEQLIDVKTLLDIAGNFETAKEVLDDLVKDGLIEGVSSVQGSDNSLVIDSSESIQLTEKGIKELNSTSILKRLLEAKKQYEEKSKLYEQTIENYEVQKPIIDALNSIDLSNITSAKQLAELSKVPQIPNGILEYYNSPAFRHFVENVQNLQKATDIIDITSKNTKKQSKGTKKTQQNKKESNNDESYIFEGILGQNCGDYITIDDSNKDDRLPDRIIHEKTGQHFIVKNGIKVLRGFAKASDLYLASEPDKKNYQREEDDVHLNELSEFISEMNPSGKYLPELTFVARGGYELCRPDWGKKLTATQLGFFKNSNYYQLHLNGTKLYRIDGNHRLEALQKLSTEQKEYYIPFAIILMGKQVLFDDTDLVESSLGLEFSGNYALVDDQDEKKIIDMEAFLFYFLNAKAKRLTTEENYRGLISSNWQKHEIEIANKNIILLQRLNKLLEDNILHNDFCNNEPLKQISEILEKINEDVDLNKFVEIVKIMNNLLAADRWQNLKKFEFYCQLIFYVAYKHEDETECRQILNNLEYWVEKYNFDNTTFDNPILLYNNAQKTNNVNPINVFVAMPFDDIHINNFTEWIETAIKNIEENKPQYKGRIHLYEIMRHRGYNIDLMDDIMEKINNCSIFIAEISPCKYTFEDKQILCDANPNVMYELGIAYNLKKPIILMRESSDFPKVPSDIQEKYRNTYNRSNTKTTREIIENTISAILEDYYD